MRPPASATAVAVPPGHERVVTLRAVGHLNYECRPLTGMAGAYAWTLAAYDASLQHWTGFPVGRLYQGPTWAHRDGSKLTGELIGSVAAGPDRLPLQLWRARPGGRKGELSDVAFIRRINAVGDRAPAKRCTALLAGVLDKRGFQAEYEFFARKTTPVSDGSGGRDFLLGVRVALRD